MQNHAPFQLPFLSGASIKMPHSCCVPECCDKGYRTTVIDGKEVKVSFHKFPDTDSKENAELRRKWLHAICRDVDLYRSCSFVMLQYSDTTRLVDRIIMYVVRILMAWAIIIMIILFAYRRELSTRKVD